MRLPQQTRLFFSSFSQLFNLYLLNNSQFSFKQYKMKTLQWILIALFLILLVSVSHFVYTRITFYQSYDMKLDDVLAFTEKASFTVGEPIELKIHSKDDCFGQLFKIDDSLTLILDSINFEKFNQSNNYNPIVGFAWRTNLVINSDSLNSGYYYFKVFKKNNPNNFYCHPIIISPKKAKSISIIASTNTWQAYNNYGGKSNYVDNVSPLYFKKIIPFIPKLKPITYCSNQRPYSFMINETGYLDENRSKLFCQSGKITEIDTFGNHNNPILSYDTIPNYIQHFMGEQYLVKFLEEKSISYGVYSDIDFAYNADIYNSDLIIFHMHSEYWSQEMIGKLQTYCSNGGHVVFASGNNIYREVEFYEKGIKVYDEIDPNLTRSMIGTYYSDVTYPKSSSFKVDLFDHWVFEGCNLIYGDTIFTEGSGWETDKIGNNSNGFQVLATGLNSVGPAQMVIKEFNTGGWIFNASSMTFTQSIYKKDSSTCFKVLLNLIEDATKNN
jgi:hypothetical protein